MFGGFFQAARKLLAFLLPGTASGLVDFWACRMARRGSPYNFPERTLSMRLAGALIVSFLSPPPGSRFPFLAQ